MTRKAYATPTLIGSSCVVRNTLCGSKDMTEDSLGYKPCCAGDIGYYL